MAVKTQGLSGPALFLAASGALLAYAGIKGSSPLGELRGILSGQRPEPLSTASSAAPLQSAAPASSSAESPAGVSGSGIVSIAQRQLGKPYRWGATGPNAFDCSGLVYYCYKESGLPIKRQTTYGYAVSRQFVTVDNPAPGDIVVRPGHMGIVIGGGKMIHAPHTGSTVRVANIPTRTGSAMSVWKYRRFSVAGGRSSRAV
jgi:cell wall-associated NlpC family hydrolase